MYKTRSQSMQKGAAKCDSKRMSKEDFYRQTLIEISKTEQAHFGFGGVDRDAFVESLRPLIRRYAKSGFRKPHDVARLLNKQGIRTAIREEWTPRLAWFLLRFIFAGDKQKKLGKLPRRDGSGVVPGNHQTCAKPRPVRDR
jgi:hypothetical protein